MQLIKAPQKIKIENNLSVFLAGSIESDTAINWQELLINKLTGESVTILNPRRDKWDNSWKQEITNPEFKEQVDWELDALDQADLIVMYFDKNTKSPISLLELGLFANSKKLIVCCPDGFWRKGNIDIVCERFSIKQKENLKGLIIEIKKKINM